MGGDWVMRHPQSERMLYLCLNFSFSETFSKSWDKKVQHINHGDVQQPGEADPDNNVAAKGAGKDKGESKASLAQVDNNKGNGEDNGKGKDTGKGKPTEPGKAKGKGKGKDNGKGKGNGDMKNVIKACNVIKTDFLKNATQAMELIKLIDEAQPNSKWAWAKNDENRGWLHETASDLNKDMELSHNRRMMTEDITQMAKTIEDKNKVMEDLLEFQKLSPKVETLKGVLTTMLKRSVA